MMHITRIRTWLLTGAVFFIGTIAVLLLQSKATIPDPDILYHAGMSQQIAAAGIPLALPWLSGTYLAERFFDHALLYHILGIPFTLGPDPLAGYQLYTALWAGIVTGMYYLTTRALRMRWGWFWTMLAFGNASVLFRLSIGKVTAASLCLLLGLIIAYDRRRWWLIVALSGIYVWMYGGFIVAAALGLLFAFAHLVHSGIVYGLREQGIVDRGTALYRGIRAAADRASALMVGIPIMGISIGLAIHPQLRNAWPIIRDQVMRIGLIGKIDAVNIGVEWLPMQLVDMTAMAGAAILLLLGGTIAWAYSFRQQEETAIALLLLSYIYFALLLRSQRAIEYFVPLVMLTAGYIISAAIKGRSIKTILNLPANTHTVLVWVVAPGILITYLIAHIFGAHQFNAHGARRDYLSGVAGWIRAHAPAESIIFHSDWDDVPHLWYHDPEHRYIVGLDPRFMAYDRPEQYRLYMDITTGGRTDRVCELIRSKFGASYIVVDAAYTAFNSAVQRDASCRTSYTDTDATIYAITK